MIKREILEWAETLWRYHRLGMQLRPARAILALGSHDLRTAAWAAQLFRTAWAPYVLCSGGLGNLTRGVWKEPEAVRFAALCRASGVPEDRLLVEPYSTNTGENIKFSRRMLRARGMEDGPFIFVHKPYMERRTAATVEANWPTARAIVTSPPYKLLEYPQPGIPLSRVIEIMVGDFQRILLYPLRGWQTAQEVPEAVLRAYLGLVKEGYTGHLLPGEPLLPPKINDNRPFMPR